MPVPDHADPEEDPIINTVTATGMAGSNTVSDTASHSTDILHPDIEIDKKVSTDPAGPFTDGPAQAHVGDTVYYEFEVTNEGDTPLDVDFSDAQCDSAATLDSGDTDADGLLDVSETWTYSCSTSSLPATRIRW